MVSSSVAQRSIVDLPPPEGPMIDTTSPFSTLSDTPFKTSNAPNAFLAFCISKTAIALPSL